jgi:chorismate synthase
MASNSFGTLFRITTWGESHGPAIGCIIDGCPAGLELSQGDIQKKLDLRRPGRGEHVTPRNERDQVEILSGVFDGKTTGTPICLLIKNEDADSSKYDALKNVLRPCHANFTYLKKFGIFDHRGGGRASARETAARVAAGAIAEKILEQENVKIISYLQAIGNVEAACDMDELISMEKEVSESSIFCPKNVEQQFISLINEVKADGDTIGGVVESIAINVPAGWGDPVYEKIEAKLAFAMLGLPAAKAFEIGEGFRAKSMRGSEFNDPFQNRDGKVEVAKNSAGGVIAGITTGAPIVIRTHFKPASSIRKQQETVDLEGNKVVFSLPAGSRHDSCVAIRAVPVCQAMVALTLVDAYLMSRLSLISQ